MTTKQKVLYVDDEPVNLMLIEIHLSKKFIVLKAADGESGLRTLSDNPDIRVVLSDMKMPGMNGLEFIKTAKKLYPEIKFYLFTGYEISEDINKALDNKLILRYFGKPFKIREIESEIESALK